MTITLYKNYSDPLRMNKNIEKIGVFNCEFLGVADIIHPVVKLNINLDFNYCYIDSLNRYYYVTNPKIINGKEMTVDLSEDVKMTYKHQILNTVQHVIRQEKLFNMYLQDDAMVVESKIQRQVKYLNPSEYGFPFHDTTGSSEQCYVLNTL